MKPMAGLKRYGRTGVRAGLGIVLAMGIVALLLWAEFDWQHNASQLMTWLGQWGMAAAFWLVGLQALMVYLIIPGPYFTMAAGFLFGVMGGGLCAVTGTLLGAIMAFFTARLFFGEKAARWILSHPRIQVMERAFAQRGWKIVMLTRMIPGFPFKLSNYFFGLTRFSFPDFLVGTALGIVPLTLVSVYAGSLASDISRFASGKTVANEWAWAVSVAGFCAMAGLVVYITVVARRELKQILPGEEI